MQGNLPTIINKGGTSHIQHPQQRNSTAYVSIGKNMNTKTVRTHLHVYVDVHMREHTHLQMKPSIITACKCVQYASADEHMQVQINM